MEITLGIIGGKWKIMILWNLARESKRFGELRKLIPEISQKMLTQQLKELEGDGIIDRKVYAEVPPRVEYSISQHGRSIIPVLNAMAQWGIEHINTADIELVENK